jgi:aldose 1-epimerase
MSLILIRDGVAEAAIVPELGAGLAWFDLITGRGPAAIFRARRDVEGARPFDLAMNVLAPWSNRISGGGFFHRGEFHPLERNLEEEPFPIHGNAFSSPWQLESHEATCATLTLFSHGPGPFSYHARLTYELEQGTLAVALTIENRAAKPMPFGVGLHPWLPRAVAGTSLTASCERVVLENPSHLPAGEIPVSERDAWNFNVQRPLPYGWINNVFRGWDGRARVDWPDRALKLEIAADPPLATFVVYSPGAHADFFCFEPVTHLVDAHNMKDDSGGLIELASGQSMSVGCRFRPTAS